MKTILSAKLKLHTTLEQFARLRQTQLAYRDACNFVGKYAFEHGKMSNTKALQKGTYEDIRSCFRHTLRADLVGARNMTMRTPLIRQDWVSTGTLSECPDGADREAKAARLQRYAELRWGLATSPSPLGDLGF